MKMAVPPRRAWRLYSVQAAAVLAVLSVLQAEALPLFRFAIPADVWPWVSAVMGAAVVVLRLVAQPGVLDEPPVPPPPHDEAAP